VAHRGDRDVPLRARRVLAATCAVLGAITCLGVLVLWPRGDVVSGLLRDVTGLQETYDAEVLSVITEPCRGTLPDDDIQCAHMTIRLLDGPDEGERASLEFQPESPQASIEQGTTIVVARNPDAPKFVRYGYVDIQRGRALLILAVVFAAAVVLLGRVRGVTALLGLAATFFLLLNFALPAILSGRDPTVVAAFAASAMAFLALYLAHGFTAMTSIALLGTLASLLLTVLLGNAFVGLSQFSGFASEEAFLVNIGASDLDLSGLVLAGVIIGALGAIDDMTVTQSSAVAELAAADSQPDRRALFRSGLRIGRDHVSSTVNTLFLAYVGASLPLLLLFILTDQSAWFVAKREFVATEIVRALVGSIGLVASVPLTTWLAAYCFTLRETKPLPPESDEGSVTAEQDEPARRCHMTDEEEASALAPEEHPIPDRWLGRIRRRS
jgi:uncharacterized membrane protein